MPGLVIFSEDDGPVEWSETERLKLEFGPKGATLASLPREWTLPFALISAKAFSADIPPEQAIRSLGADFISRISMLAEPVNRLYVRSSVVGETIWDRGSYNSITVDVTAGEFESALVKAVKQVLGSAPGKQVGLVIQRFVPPRARGEFGNLMRVSKTRDHWELSSESAGTTSRVRFNTQRDSAANSRNRLQLKSGVSRERLFGSVASWLNNHLLRGKSQRVNCEWIADHNNVYLVQLDAEDEDFFGVNPFQLRVRPFTIRAPLREHFFRMRMEKLLQLGIS